MRRVLFALLPLLLVGWVANPAAATTVDDVVSALQSDPVYNDPEAENALTDAQAADLSDQIRSSGSSVFIAILPEAAKGSQSTEDVVTYLQSNVGEPGVYAAVVGNQVPVHVTRGSHRGLPAAAGQRRVRGVESVRHQRREHRQRRDRDRTGD